MSDIFDVRIDGMPVVRIHRIVIENFKGVEYGEIDMACSRKYTPHGTKSDLLAVYGQNGSGKTSLVDALEVIRYLLLGWELPDRFAEYIMLGKEYSRIEVLWEFQYPNGDVRKVSYEAKLAAKEAKKEQNRLLETFGQGASDRSAKSGRIQVTSEILKAGGSFGGERRVGKEFLNTVSAKPFGPVTKCKELCPDGDDMLRLQYNRMDAERYGKSFVFMEDSLRIFEKQVDKSYYSNILMDLNLYAQFYLYIIKTGNTGMIRMNSMIPICFREPIWVEDRKYTSVLLDLQNVSRLPDELFEGIRQVLANINPVLGTLISGLQLELRSLGPVMAEGNIPGQNAEVIAIRNGQEMPLRYESDGVRKLISTLQLLIDAFHDESMTIVIDEFDAGIFEYLLGKIVEIFQEYGKGQFIFTIHDLRPMEVLNKNYIILTTSNPKNRYYRMKDLKAHNNMRDVYFRNAEIDDQDEQLYVHVPKEEIVRAFVGNEE